MAAVELGAQDLCEVAYEVADGLECPDYLVDALGRLVDEADDEQQVRAILALARLGEVFNEGLRNTFDPRLREAAMN